LATLMNIVKASFVPAVRRLPHGITPTGLCRESR